MASWWSMSFSRQCHPPEHLIGEARIGRSYTSQLGCCPSASCQKRLKSGPASGEDEYGYPVIWKVPVVEAAPQVTVAVAVPPLVLVPVIQFHCTRPEPSAVARPRPCDWLCLLLGRVTQVPPPSGHRLHSA